MNEDELTDNQKLMALGMAVRMLRCQWHETATMLLKTPQECLDMAIACQSDPEMYAWVVRDLGQHGGISSESFVEEALSKARSHGAWPDWIAPRPMPSALEAEWFKRSPMSDDAFTALGLGIAVRIGSFGLFPLLAWITTRKENREKRDEESRTLRMLQDSRQRQYEPPSTRPPARN